MDAAVLLELAKSEATYCGATYENIPDWIDAGAVALSVGRPLMAGIAPGDGKALAARTRQFIERIREARAGI